MDRMLSTIFVCSLVSLVGCSSSVNPGKISQPVEIHGTVTLAGKPAASLILCLQPTDSGLPAEIPIGPNGSYQGKVVPGKYTYYLAAKQESKLKQVPPAYRAGSLERQVSVSGGEVSLKLD